nr:hypothetical protein [uncultured Pseudomonas sp.]
MDVNRFEITRLAYAQVPLYRRRWFVMLTLLGFIPATLLITLTGDIYAKQGQTVYKFKDSAVHQLIIMALVFIAAGLFLAANR